MARTVLLVCRPVSRRLIAREIAQDPETFAKATARDMISGETEALGSFACPSLVHLSIFPSLLVASFDYYRSQSWSHALRTVGRPTNNPHKASEGHATSHGMQRPERGREQRDNWRRNEKRHVQQHDKRETHQANHRPLGHAQSLPQPHRQIHDESDKTLSVSPPDRSSDVDGSSVEGSGIVREQIASPEEMSGHEPGRR